MFRGHYARFGDQNCESVGLWGAMRAAQGPRKPWTLKPYLFMRSAQRAWMLGMSGTQNCESVGCEARWPRSSVHAICEGSPQVGSVTLKKTEKEG